MKAMFIEKLTVCTERGGDYDTAVHLSEYACFEDRMVFDVGGVPVYFRKKYMESRKIYRAMEDEWIESIGPTETYNHGIEVKVNRGGWTPYSEPHYVAALESGASEIPLPVEIHIEIATSRLRQALVEICERHDSSIREFIVAQRARWIRENLRPLPDEIWNLLSVMGYCQVLSSYPEWEEEIDEYLFGAMSVEWGDPYDPEDLDDDDDDPYDPFYSPYEDNYVY